MAKITRKFITFAQSKDIYKTLLGLNKVRKIKGNTIPLASTGLVVLNQVVCCSEYGYGIVVGNDSNIAPKKLLVAFVNENVNSIDSTVRQQIEVAFDDYGHAIINSRFKISISKSIKDWDALLIQEAEEVIRKYGLIWYVSTDSASYRAFGMLAMESNSRIVEVPSVKYYIVPNDRRMLEEQRNLVKAYLTYKCIKWE